MKLTELTGTVLAAHEAGHAVVAVVLRLSLRYVTLRPRGPEHALTYTRERRNEPPHYLERQAVCYLAGIAADQLLNGRVTFGTGIDDIENATRNAERLGVEDVQEFLRVKQREAEAIVFANRVAVEAVPARSRRPTNAAGCGGAGDHRGLTPPHGLACSSAAPVVRGPASSGASPPEIRSCPGPMRCRSSAIPIHHVVPYAAGSLRGQRNRVPASPPHKHFESFD
jgi:hypothetical protein